MSDARETAEAIVFALKKRQNFPDFGRLTSAIERAIASRDAVIAEREAQLAETREKLTMHLAHVGAWLSEIVGFTGVADVKTVAEATAQVSTKFAALRSRAEAAESRIAGLEQEVRAEAARAEVAEGYFNDSAHGLYAKIADLEAKLAERMRFSDADRYAMEDNLVHQYESHPEWEDAKDVVENIDLVSLWAAIERHRNKDAGGEHK